MSAVAEASSRLRQIAEPRRMTPSQAFIILAGITLALAAIGAALVRWATRKDRRRQIAEHEDSYWHRRT